MKNLSYKICLSYSSATEYGNKLGLLRIVSLSKFLYLFLSSY